MIGLINDDIFLLTNWKVVLIGLNLAIMVLMWRSFKDSGINIYGESEKFHLINTVYYPSFAINLLTWERIYRNFGIP